MLEGKAAVDVDNNVRRAGISGNTEDVQRREEDAEGDETGVLMRDMDMLGKSARGKDEAEEVVLELRLDARLLWVGEDTMPGVFWNM